MLRHQLHPAGYISLLQLAFGYSQSLEGLRVLSAEIPLANIGKGEGLNTMWCDPTYETWNPLAIQM